MSELTLDDMLDDPIVHLIMARDGVEVDEVRALVRRLSTIRTTAGNNDSRPAHQGWDQAA